MLTITEIGTAYQGRPRCFAVRAGRRYEFVLRGGERVECYNIDSDGLAEYRGMVPLSSAPVEVRQALTGVP